MFTWFDAGMARRIDTLTWNHGKRTKREGELKQLSTLFGDRYLRALHRIITAGLISARGPKAVLTIKLAWIDKIPVAASTSLSKRTELGDAVLFAIEETKVRQGVGPGPMRARAVILQAKVTRDERQIRTPTVPIAPLSGSTARELTLLSRWPRFDLYKTANSGRAVAIGIQLQSSRSPPPFGWFLAAARGARLPASIRHVWQSWWMLGPPDQGHPCDVSFGRFLRAFVSGQQLASTRGIFDAGASFQCPAYPPPTFGASDWDRVCAEIIRIVEDPGMRAPPSVFGAGFGRMTSFSDIPLHFVLSGATPPRLAYVEEGWPPWWLGPTRRTTNRKRSYLRGWAGRLADVSRGALLRRRRMIPVLIIHALVPEADG